MPHVTIETSHGSLPMPRYESLEEQYFEIETLFDLADELVQTAASDFTRDAQAQLALVSPLAEHLADAADVLSGEFVEYAQAQAAVKPHSGNKKRIESALRRVYMAMDDYQNAARAVGEQGYEGIKNIADLVVKKIKRQLEVVIAICVDFVQLSLDRIMQHDALAELKRRQEKIAMMLHGISQSPAGA